jgi:DNA-binding MarR family transcriptional regulator
MNLKDVRGFRRTLRRFERVSDALVTNCCANVTLAQCVVLMEIDENGRLTMGQLAARLRLDNSTLSRTIDSLVAKGLVEREREERDRRVIFIRLTEAGKASCRVIHKENDEHCRRVFANIPAAKRTAVIRDFEVLVQAYLDCEADSILGARSGSPVAAGKKEEKS